MEQEGQSSGHSSSMQKRIEIYSSSSVLLCICVHGQGRSGLGDFGCLWAYRLMQSWSSSLCCLGISGNRTTGTPGMDVGKSGIPTIQQHLYGFLEESFSLCSPQFCKPSLESGCWGLNKDTKVQTRDVGRELENLSPVETVPWVWALLQGLTRRGLRVLRKNPHSGRSHPAFLLIWCFCLWSL